LAAADAAVQSPRQSADKGSQGVFARLPAMGGARRRTVDVSEALGIAGALQAQKLNQVKLETTLKSAKDHMDLQKDMVMQLLASIPSVSPEGIGGKLDTYVEPAVPRQGGNPPRRGGLATARRAGGGRPSHGCTAPTPAQTETRGARSLSHHAQAPAGEAKK